MAQHKNQDMNTENSIHPADDMETLPSKGDNDIERNSCVTITSDGLKGYGKSIPGDHEEESAVSNVLITPELSSVVSIDTKVIDNNEESSNILCIYIDQPELIQEWKELAESNVLDTDSKVITYLLEM